MDQICASRAVEHRDDLVRTRDESAEGFYHWDFCQPHANFRESYLHGQGGIAFRRAEISAGSGEPNQDGFVFEAAPSAYASGDRDDYTGRDRIDRDQPFVFPQVVQFGEEPQSFVPSIVRLDRFDRSDLSGGQPPFAFDALQRIKKILVRGVEWEVRCCARIYVIAASQRGCEQIKAASDRIDGVTDMRADQWIKRDFLVGNYEMIGSIRIVLYDDLIRVTPLPGQEVLLQNWDLGFGPTNRSFCSQEIAQHG
jgi:hypothetical protein